MNNNETSFRVTTRCDAKGCGKIATQKIYISATKFCLCEDCYRELCKQCAKTKNMKAVVSENAEN